MKKNIRLSAATILVILFTLSNCTQETNQSKTTKDLLNSEQYKEGLAIVDQNCITCHPPSGGIDNRIAPPLFAIKAHYEVAEPNKADFINAMTEFLVSPKIENSKMPKAIEKFGLMPNLGFSKEQYEAVAIYIYHADLNKPDWFEEHHQKEKAELLKYSEESAVDYLKKGMTLALSTKAILGKNLLSAIKTNGADGAVTFCNEKAIALTDSMAQALNASIKRVSDNNRNPNNAANETELAYIQQAKSDIEENGKASPKVIEQNGKMVGYYPIMTNKMCMQCHGKPTLDITSKTLSTINTLYPEDKATGYLENQLRGIWVVEMER